MLGKIIAVSGSDWRDKEYFNDLSIDKFIISHCTKKIKKVLFIPTASGDNQQYCTIFNEVYNKKLGCETSFLLLYNQVYSSEQLLSIVDGVDIIYIPGGDTKEMLRKWRSTGFDKILIYFYLKGGILAGVSAGAMCRFSGGLGDSGSVIKGFNFIQGNYVPHFSNEQVGGITNVMNKSRINNVICMPDYSLFYKSGNIEQIGIFKPSLGIVLLEKQYDSISEKKLVLHKGFHDISLLYN